MVWKVKRGWIGPRWRVKLAWAGGGRRVKLAWAEEARDRPRGVGLARPVKQEGPGVEGRGVSSGTD